MYQRQAELPLTALMPTEKCITEIKSIIMHRQTGLNFYIATRTSLTIFDTASDDLLRHWRKGKSKVVLEP
jgi:hypothetical protein